MPILTLWPITLSCETTQTSYDSWHEFCPNFLAIFLQHEASERYGRSWRSRWSDKISKDFFLYWIQQWLKVLKIVSCCDLAMFHSEYDLSFANPPLDKGFICLVRGWFMYIIHVSNILQFSLCTYKQTKHRLDSNSIRWCLHKIRCCLKPVVCTTLTMICFGYIFYRFSPQITGTHFARS